MALTTPRLASSRSALAAAALAGLTTLLSGCGSHGGADAAGPSPSASAATPSADPTTTAKNELLAVYRKMWSQEETLYSSGSFNGVDLNDYAQNKALSNIKVTAAYYQDHGIVMHGAPVLSPRVTALDLAAKPGTATIKDCVDSSKYLPYYGDTGKPVDIQGSASARHINTFQAQFFGGKWYIVDSSIDRSSTC
ncbi:hypothetical protein K7472_31400 [Streptomyces sp. PTM05]|uniref:Lipoprotein n=1 Tax=Streptantibioticus parmotrematis TaxID=2873249 RepID=A0ABS7R1H5_9ACTN|nr:hypothetical protein [Streptantibioticus parmotrematis]MBY8889315.1 hypothetical protein [Streptantibioticus parmotrematis]